MLANELENRIKMIDQKIGALKTERAELRKQLNTVLAVENAAALVGPENVELLRRLHAGETLSREETLRLVMRKKAGTRLAVKLAEVKAEAMEAKPVE